MTVLHIKPYQSTTPTSNSHTKNLCVAVVAISKHEDLIDHGLITRFRDSDVHWQRHRRRDEHEALGCGRSMLKEFFARTTKFFPDAIGPDSFLKAAYAKVRSQQILQKGFGTNKISTIVL